MPNPALDMVDKLVADATLSLTKGTNAFFGEIRPTDGMRVPQNSVFVMGGPGEPPDRTHVEEFEIRTAVVTVFVRWNRFEEGDTKARAILNVIQAISITGYLDVALTQSEPTVVGRDSEGLHLWMISAIMRFQQNA